MFAKFHWNPVLGTHSLCSDAAVKISGADPYYHRRDLWEAIESGEYPAWELGLQVFTEEQARRQPTPTEPAGLSQTERTRVAPTLSASFNSVSPCSCLRMMLSVDTLEARLVTVLHDPGGGLRGDVLSTVTVSRRIDEMRVSVRTFKGAR